MKIIKVIFLTILFLKSSLTVFAQDCATFLGTKTLYIKPVTMLSAVPAGYTPVFINYVGRHGARHLTKDVKTNYAYQLLLKADSLHALTQKGQELEQMVLRLEKVEKGNLKSISAEGRKELQGIGQRLFTDNQALFKQPVNLKVSVTKEIRTAQSADAFLTGLNQELPAKAAVSKVTDDTNLRFYDVSPAYDAFEKSGSVDKMMQSIQKNERIDLVDKALAERVFKTGFAQELLPADKEKFAADIFGFATIVYSLQNEILQAGMQPADLDFKSVFTCEELTHLGKVDAAEDYLKKGPGTNASGIQVKIAVPLLINFIKTTDEFIATGNYTAQLRFAHAETIIPFAALLNISSADKPAKDLNNIARDWEAGKIAQLSSNIQWVLYQQKGTKNYLVKVLLNEKETHITGLESKNFPYYRWADLKAFYLKKLSKWNINPDADMDLYLKQVALNK